jgi:hypothetical protein
MHFRPLLRILTSAIASFFLFVPAHAAWAQAESQLAKTVKLILSKGFTPDWQGVE